MQDVSAVSSQQGPVVLETYLAEHVAGPVADFAAEYRVTIHVRLEDTASDLAVGASYGPDGVGVCRDVADFPDSHTQQSISPGSLVISVSCDLPDCFWDPRISLTAEPASRSLGSIVYCEDSWSDDDEPASRSLGSAADSEQSAGIVACPTHVRGVLSGSNQLLAALDCWTRFVDGVIDMFLSGVGTLLKGWL